MSNVTPTPNKNNEKSLCVVLKRLYVEGCLSNSPTGRCLTQYPWNV